MEKLEDKIISKESSTDENSSGTDLPKLITDLTKIKNEGNKLYKQKNIEEAKKKFEEGHELYRNNLSSIKREIENNETFKEIIILHKKILSNIALCYYKQENYEKAVEYDLKIIPIDPKFGKSIVRLFNSYSRLNKIAQAVFYGELFLELDQEIKYKFKGTEAKVLNEQQILKAIQKKEKENIKKVFIYGVPALILLLAILIFFLYRKI